MAFYVRTRSLNHTPQWYHDHCRDEDGGSAAFRAMLTADMKFIDADIDKKMTYMERVHYYEEQWNRILTGKDKAAYVLDLQKAMEREGQLGFQPQEEYTKGVFASIGRVIDKYDLPIADVREYLKWKAKQPKKVKKLKKLKVPKNKSSVLQLLHRKNFLGSSY